MAEIVDALVVTLGLDTKGYEKGSKDAALSTKKLKDGLGDLRNETFGLLAAFAGASTLKAFFSYMVSGDAATGRLATNFGVATEELSAFQGAVRQTGGSMADANASFARANDLIFQSKQGITDSESEMKALGLSAKDLQNVPAMLEGIAAASERMDRNRFFNIVKQMGFNDATINVLALGKARYKELTDEALRNGAATRKSADEAIAYQKALADLSEKIEGKVRPVIQGLTVVFEELAQNEDAVDATMVGLAGAAFVLAIVFAPIPAFVAALTTELVLIYTQLERVGRQFHVGARLAEAWGAAVEIAKDLAHGDLSGAEAAYKRHTDYQDGLYRADVTPSEHAAIVAQNAKDGFGPNGPAPGGSAREEVLSFWKRTGRSDVESRGLLAAMLAENDTLDPSRRNGKGSSAVGLGQWLLPRQGDFYKRYGKSVAHATRAEQLEFLNYELTNGKEKAAGAAIHRAAASGDPLAVAIAYITQSMRPGKGEAGDIDRARRALYGARATASPRLAAGGGTHTTTTHIGTMTVHSASTDGKGLLRDVGAAVRNRSTITQADTGMQGT